MKRKEEKYGKDARDAIKTVAAALGNTVGKTLGPAGRNYQTPQGITNDGYSILANIRFNDECEDNVALAFHEIAKRTDDEVGDGTTGSTVIGTELTLDLIDKIPDLDAPIPGQKSVMDLSRELEEEKNKAIAILEKKVIPVTTLEQVEQVAFTSMEDKEIAKVVAATIFKAGKDSYTALDEGFNGKIETDVQSGIEMPLQVAAPFMFTNGKEAVYEGTIPVLVANHLFEDYRGVQRFMQSMIEYREANKISFPVLVIVAKQFSIPFVQAVARIFTASKGSVRFLLLSNAHLSDDLFEDTAAFCDAKYIDTHPKGGQNISTAKFLDCGMITKVVATPKGTVFYGGKGLQMNPKAETSRVNARILQIRTLLDKESDTKKRKAMERRIAEFSGGKATIYVDAKTAAEKYYLKLKVQDCMNSCKTALEGGMVPGGGVSLKEVAEELGESSILYRALVAPYLRIQQNAGGKLEIGPEVMDSYLCVKAGVENAVSVVKTVITIEGIIAEHPQSMVEEIKNLVAGV